MHRKVGFTQGAEARKAFASRLRLAMKERHTIDELAGLIGMSRSGLQKWLSGETDAGWSGVVAAARACDVSLDWLATGEGAMRPSGARGMNVIRHPQPPPREPQDAWFDDEGGEPAEIRMAGPLQPPPPSPPTTDHRLIGRLTEQIVRVHKEMGVGLALHQAAERAAMEHDRIVAAVPDPDDRLIRIGEFIAELRQELRAKAADPGSSKQRA